MLGNFTKTKRTLALCLLASASNLGASAQTSNVQRFEVFGLVIVWAADANGNAPIASDFVIDSGTGSTAAGSGDLDLINTDVFTVVTGSLEAAADSETGPAPFRLRLLGDGTDRFDIGGTGNQVLDASDTFNAFQLGPDTFPNSRRSFVSSSFYVASNTAFSIDAQASPSAGTDQDDFERIQVRLRVAESGNDGLAFGSAAQFPHTGDSNTAGSAVPNNSPLSDFQTPQRIFEGNRRTARLPGSIVEQSVRFDARYRYNSGAYELSQGVIDTAADVVYTVYIP